MRLFITVSGLGLCGDNGKNVAVSYGYKRRLGDNNRPLSSLFNPLINEAANIAGWDTVEDKLADLAELKRWVTELYEGEKECER